MNSKRTVQYIRNLYLNLSNPTSFTSPEKIFQYLKRHGKYKVPLSQIKKILQDIPTYTLHRKRIDKGKKAQAVCRNTHYLFYSDACHMTSYADANKHKYFILNINCLTRQLEATAVPDLTSYTVSRVLDKYLKRNHYEYMYSDCGSEYIGKPTQLVLKSHNCKHIVATSGMKSFLAEISIKNIKNRLTRYMYTKKTRKWPSILPLVVKNYNNSPHTRLGNLSPNEAANLSLHKLWSIVYEKEKIPRLKQRKLRRKPKVRPLTQLRVGDKVRISKIQKLFKKYDTNYSSEIFEIISVEIKSRVPVFRIKDQQNSIISGIFYSNELVKVEDAKHFIIDSILKKKSMFGKLFYLVKWQGQDEPTFISASDLDKYGRSPHLSEHNTV